MDEKLKQLFSKTRLLVSKEDFAVVGLPAVADVQIGGEGFSAVIKERGITTIILPVEKWEAVAQTTKGAVVEKPFKIIMFSTVIPWDSSPGFISEISRALSSDGISFGAVSAHSHCHIYVKASEKDRALKALEKLISECKEGPAAPPAPVEEGEEE